MECTETSHRSNHIVDKFEPIICDLKQFLNNSFKSIHKTQLYCPWKSVEPAYPSTWKEGVSIEVLVKVGYRGEFSGRLLEALDFMHCKYQGDTHSFFINIAEAGSLLDY